MLFPLLNLRFPSKVEVSVLNQLALTLVEVNALAMVGWMLLHWWK